MFHKSVSTIKTFFLFTYLIMIQVSKNIFFLKNKVPSEKNTSQRWKLFNDAFLTYTKDENSAYKNLSNLKLLQTVLTSYLHSRFEKGFEDLIDQNIKPYRRQGEVTKPFLFG